MCHWTTISWLGHEVQPTIKYEQSYIGWTDGNTHQKYVNQKELSFKWRVGLCIWSCTLVYACEKEHDKKQIWKKVV